MASDPSNAARPSTTTTKPTRAPTSLSASSIVDSKATLTGKHLITTGASSVIHPGARLISTYGRVTIGAGSIVGSRVRLGHEALPSHNSGSNLGETPTETPDQDDDDDSHMLPTLDISLGQNVTLEPGAVVSALMIGDGSVVGAGAVIGPGAVLGQHCRIAPRCVVAPGELLPDFTVIYGGSGHGKGRSRGARAGRAAGGGAKGSKEQGAGARRRTQREGLEGLREAAHVKQVEVLGKLIKSDLAKHGGSAQQV